MRVKTLGRRLFRAVFRQGWLSSRVESEPVVKHLRIAVEESWERQDRPFRLDPADSEEHETDYRLSGFLIRRNVLYVACYLLGAALLVGLNWIFGVQPSELPLGTAAAFVTSVIAIGLPLVTAFGAFRTRGRWAEEYLFRATHLAWFTRTTYAVAALNLLSIALAPVGARGSWQSSGMAFSAGAAWGLALATLLYLTAIVLEIIHCSRSPEYACAASANMLSERLLDSFLRNAYLTAFVGAHQHHLEQLCKALGHVDGPETYFAAYYAADHKQREDGELRVRLREFVIERQFLDYRLSGLKRLDRLVGRANSHLHLTAHQWTGTHDRHGADIGFLAPPRAKAPRAKARWFRPRRDFCPQVRRHSQEDLQNLFLHEIGLRLAAFDTAGYRLHLRAVRRAAGEFAKVWADLEVRRQFRPGLETPDERTDRQRSSFSDVYRWLWLNVRLLNQILHHVPQVERTPYLEVSSFLRCHQGAYQDLLRDCARRSNAEMFGLLLRLLPYFYNAVYGFCKSEEQKPGAAKEQLRSLGEMRAKWGFGCAWPPTFLGHLRSDVDSATRWKFLLFLHQSACVWIRKAQESDDRRLAKELAKGIAKAMGTDARWRKEWEPPAEADLLMARHWLILGETLGKVLSEEATLWADLPVELTPRPIRQMEPEQLLRFYDSHRRVDEGEWGFEDLRPEPAIRMPLLGGPGVGDARWVPQHEEEMRLAFVWLLLACPEPKPDEPLRPVPVDVAGAPIRSDLEKIIKRFRHDPWGHRIWRLPPNGQEHWIEEWLRRCADAEAAKRDEEIAGARIDTGKVSKFREEFRQNFGESLVLTQFLVDVGGYQAKGNLAPLNPMRSLPKDCVIAGPHAVGNTLGNHFGRNYGHGLDLEFMRTLLNVKEAATELCTDYDAGIRRAAQWLEERGATGNEGLMCVLGRAYVGSLLLDNDDFVPAWKEAVGIEGFEGRFKGFPVWQGRFEKEAKVLAVDLRGLRPLLLRPRAVQGKWADVNMRKFRPDELDEIRHAREDANEPFDEVRERQHCVVDIKVYARFQAPEPQHVILISIQQEEEEAQPLTTPVEDPSDDRPEKDGG